MLNFEKQTTYEKLYDIRMREIDKEELRIGLKKETDIVEAKIQKEINEKIGYGMFISYEEQDKIKKEVREKYSAELKEVKAKASELEEEDDEQLKEHSVLPKEYIQYDFKIEIPSLIFTMDNEFKNKLMRLNIDGFSTSFK